MKSAFFCITASLAATVALLGAAPSSPAERIDEYVRSLASSEQFSGNVLVARDGKVLFERSYGDASVEFGVRNTPQTRFRIFSTSKQITATAVLQLVARRGLSLDEPIVSVLPELPASWKPATIREVLQHTSGIPQTEAVWTDGFMNGEARTQLDNLRSIAPKLPPQFDFTPGTKWAYNNLGYDLLGCVIERVSHLPLDEYFRRNIFVPAHMQDTLLQGRAAIAHQQYSGNAVISRLAYGYNGAPGTLEEAHPQEFAQAGAGGIVTTARDLLRYDDALTAGVLLPKAFVDMAAADVFPIRGGVGYGLGWIAVRTPAGKTYVHHSGGTNGFEAEYIRVPSERLCIIVLSNFGFAPVDSESTNMRHALLHIMLGPAYDPASR